jgi:Fe-S cluster biogenesis protein NfuA
VGVLNIMMQALGMNRRVSTKKVGPLSLTNAGRVRLDRVDAGIGLVVHAESEAAGWRVNVLEGPRPEGFEEIEPHVWIDPAHTPHLFGLKLDHDGQRWRVKLKLNVSASETPNPDSRRYRVDRPLHSGRPKFFTRTAEDVPLLAQRMFAHHAVRSIMFKDNAVTIEREDAAPWAQLDRHVDASLRDHFLLCGPLIDGMASLSTERDDPLEQQVIELMERDILPAVHRDGGNIQLNHIEDGVVWVELEGACASCPASTLTLKGAVERRLKEAFPGQIHRVEAIG